jgi:superfamily II DNA helicase RecQ
MKIRKMPQLQAGYCLEGIKDELEKRIPHYIEEHHIKELLNHLSFFELETTLNLIEKDFECHPLFLVASNIISRGLPTRPSVYIEEIFSEVFDLTNRTDTQIGSFKFVATEIPEQKIKDLYSALFVVDPRIKPHSLYKQYTRSWEKLDSKFEEEFILKSIPAYVNSSINQLIEMQRPMTSIVSKSADFTEQRVDFSIEFPFLIDDKKGVVIEVDGAQHEQPSQRMHDHLRDEEIMNVGWFSTLRIKTREFDIIEEKLKRLKQLVNHWYFIIFENNYRNGFKLDSLDLMLSPFAIARIQKTLLEFIISGKLDFKKSQWDIVIIERDVTCGWLALEDLKQLLGNLFELKGEKNPIPEIRLSIVNTEEFNKSKLAKRNQCTVYGIEEVPENISCDLLLDISVLQRPGFYNYTPIINYHHFAKIRSIHSIKSTRKFKTEELIKYPEFAHKKDDRKYDFNGERVNILKNFLQNIFRKTNFREGQVEILNKALHAETVIGLLPTGGGKSLTYQLASFLQPGVTLVIDPIKSLMRDQYHGLTINLIDAGVFINSSIKKAEDRENATNRMKNAEVLFCFVSPERMQITEFRKSLIEMHQKFRSYFSYCVVDEAHCVSEWGHDFRTSYLRLGINVRKFCKPKNGIIPLFGLTATASFDVLTDVQRELGINDESVVRHDPSNRNELSYRIIEINVNEITSSNVFQFKQSVGSRKQDQILKLLKLVPSDLIKSSEYANRYFDQNSKFLPEEFSEKNFFEKNIYGKYQNSGLIFCPHKSSDINSGVDAVVLKLQDEANEKKLPYEIGYFYGADNDDSNTNQIVEKFQTDFKEDKLNILVATKAFGMGIDKSNIRFTIHFNYPNSIESFIQEAGRAGRDKKSAINYILYSSNPKVDRSILESFFEESFRGRDKEVYVLAELLSEITFPYESESETIYSELENEFDINVYFSYYRDHGQNQLYINQEFNKGYGCIDFNHNWAIKTNNRHNSFAEEEAIAVLDFTKKYILKHCSDTQQVVEWLKKQKPKPKRQGIENTLHEMKLGNTKEILIGFENDKLFQLHNILQRIHIDFNLDLIKKAIKFCYTPQQFLIKLSREYWKIHHKKIIIPEAYHDKIFSFFKHYRDVSDTSRAIYRLSIIGVIDDYEVDYKSKTYKIRIIKHPNPFYVESLKKYFLKYVSKQRTDYLIDKIENGEAKGKTTIQKCLFLLTHFVYKEIVGKRKDAIKSMEFAVDLGLDDPEKMREHIQLYFNAKYLWGYQQDGITYNLRDETSNGKEYDSGILWKYLHITNGDVDNLKHLLGSAERLLNENRNNASLLLMKAFSLILLNVSSGGKIINEKFIGEAEDNLLKGLFLFQNEKGEYDSIIENFRNEIINFNSSATDIVAGIFETLNIKQILNPLINFNDKFLNRYEARKRAYGD